MYVHAYMVTVKGPAAQPFSVAYHVKNMTMAMGYCSVVAAASNALLTLMKTLFANDGKYPTHQLLQTLQLEKNNKTQTCDAGGIKLVGSTCHRHR